MLLLFSRLAVSNFCSPVDGSTPGLPVPHHLPSLSKFTPVASVMPSVKWVFPGGSYSKASACHARDLGSIPGLGRSPGEGNGNPLQCSCLENPMDGGAWWAIVQSCTCGYYQPGITLTFIFHLEQFST